MYLMHKNARKGLLNLSLDSFSKNHGPASWWRQTKDTRAQSEEEEVVLIDFI